MCVMAMPAPSAGGPPSPVIRNAVANGKVVAGADQSWCSVIVAPLTAPVYVTVTRRFRFVTSSVPLHSPSESDVPDPEKPTIVGSRAVNGAVGVSCTGQLPAPSTFQPGCPGAGTNTRP